jgi:hypothetical protein
VVTSEGSVLASFEPLRNRDQNGCLADAAAGRSRWEDTGTGR